MPSQGSMPIPIPATQVQRKFGDVVRRVYSGEEHFVVEKDGLPVMAIISMAEYAEFMREREAREARQKEQLEQFEQAARAIGMALEQTGLSEEAIMDQVERTRQKLHEEGYGIQPAE